MRRRAFFFALSTTITVSGCTQNGSTSNTSTTSEPKTPNTKKKGEVAIWNKRETEVSVALSVGSSTKNLQLNPDSVRTSEDMIDDGEYTTISVRTSDGLAQSFAWEDVEGNEAVIFFDIYEDKIEVVRGDK